MRVRGTCEVIDSLPTWSEQAGFRVIPRANAAEQEAEIVGVLSGLGGMSNSSSSHATAQRAYSRTSVSLSLAVEGMWTGSDSELMTSHTPIAHAVKSKPVGGCMYLWASRGEARGIDRCYRETRSMLLRDR